MAIAVGTIEIPIEYRTTQHRDEREPGDPHDGEHTDHGGWEDH